MCVANCSEYISSWYSIESVLLHASEIYVGMLVYERQCKNMGVLGSICVKLSSNQAIFVTLLTKGGCNTPWIWKMNARSMLIWYHCSIAMGLLFPYIQKKKKNTNIP